MTQYPLTISATLLVAALAIACLPAGAALSGRVADSNGAAVKGARVFAEAGLVGGVSEGAVDDDGGFVIDGEFHGGVGVFAWAPGCGFGGQHHNIALGDRHDQLQIVLQPACVVAGWISDDQGNVLPGVKVAGMALLSPAKVGIPLSKLESLGFSAPTSDSQGRFTVPWIPEGGRATLKFEHPRFAQETITDVGADGGEVRIIMLRGVSVRGRVLLRGTDTSVSGAIVAARNAQPPHDTAFSASDGSGAFSLRLKPGVYLFQAHAAGRVSPGLQRVEIRGDLPEQTLSLALSGSGAIVGSVHDAKTGSPIPGVRVLLETMGRPAGAARTGADGRFRLDAAEGDNTVLFEEVPGYQPPDARSLRVQVTGGQTLELAGMWLAPLPAATP